MLQITDADGIITEYVIVDNGDDSFTSYRKDEWEAKQAQGAELGGTL